MSGGGHREAVVQSKSRDKTAIERTCVDARARYYQSSGFVVLITQHLSSLQCLKVILETSRGGETQVRVKYSFNLFSPTSQK